MILSHEFTVEGDLENVWKALLDLPRVAGCLPGATIRATDEDGRFEGTMKVKMGPMTVNYEGSASLVEVDDSRHRAVISLRAREAKGQGTALATITNDVAQVGSRVTVRAETDLQVTGPQARFGRGVMEDIGNRVLAEFAARLEQEVASDGRPASSADPDPDPDPGPERLPPVDEAFDMGAALVQTSAARTARVVAPIVVAAMALLVFWRRRR